MERTSSVVGPIIRDPLLFGEIAGEGHPKEDDVIGVDAPSGPAAPPTSPLSDDGIATTGGVDEESGQFWDMMSRLISILGGVITLVLIIR